MSGTAISSRCWAVNGSGVIHMRLVEGAANVLDEVDGNQECGLEQMFGMCYNGTGLGVDKLCQCPLTISKSD